MKLQNKLTRVLLVGALSGIGLSAAVAPTQAMASHGKAPAVSASHQPGHRGHQVTKGHKVAKKHQAVKSHQKAKNHRGHGTHRGHGGNRGHGGGGHH